ncbi:hypothetical protein Acsp06_14520 [Actinomycetospora sp. NBRC 106375]|uniref:hypothetical protein n=1 Tax=Actinomycetospora sp. NBRC 106375 TaxID=3032207 RepID=UPI0024A1FF09|nr:hypothetical protein [Actinomycetospora sp. NBRC 106375]GLZ45267.1 hypothetical protein Acsp06_14520 [Actinomycetospora sp. NBRC 106375]
MTHPAHTLGRGPARPLPSPLVPRRVGDMAEVPDDPGSRTTALLAFVTEHRARLLRVGLHLVVAALPLLAISAHVFGLVPMNVTAGLVVVPLTLLAVMLGVFSPAGEERIVLAGAMWGVLATLVYDAVRLDTVYLLGWWGDFIPRVGTWILDIDAGQSVLGAVVGYAWRYLGDGGGIGVAFFVLVAATGLRRWGERATVTAAVVFAVFPVWTGLVATVALAPRGQQQMFTLTPATVALSLVGHLVFGLVLGLGCARCRRLEQHWPWMPLLDRGRPVSVVRSPVRDGRWGPPALVAPPETDAERTEIRVERPVPLPRAAPGGRSATGPALVPEGRRASPVSGPVPFARSRSASPGERASGPVRLDRPSGPVPIERPSGPVRLDRPSGPVPVDRPSGPVRVNSPSGPVRVDSPSGPVRVDSPSGPVPAGWRASAGKRPSAPVPARDPRSGPVRLPDRGRGPEPVRERHSGPVRLAAPASATDRPPGTVSAGNPHSGPLPTWSRAVPTDARDPWLGDGGGEAASSPKPHPGAAARG